MQNKVKEFTGIADDRDYTQNITHLQRAFQREQASPRFLRLFDGALLFLPIFLRTEMNCCFTV